MPQLPQFALSVIVSAHVMPQRICPVGHIIGAHTPPVHVSVAMHARPHMPQFIALVSVSTQPMPQSVWPVGHIIAVRHAPITHVSVAMQA